MHPVHHARWPLALLAMTATMAAESNCPDANSQNELQTQKN